MAALKEIYSQHTDIIPKILKDDEKQTKALEKIVIDVMLTTAQPKYLQTQSQDSKFKPSAASGGIIRMVEVPLDPLDPPKFKRKRLPKPKPNESPPVPLMHSPPRPPTFKDQKDWKIPPCISNRKNPKGYTISLDKRLVADGRGVQINHNFPHLSEALDVAQQQARQAVSIRSKLRKEIMMKQKDQELHSLAQKARSQRAGGSGSFVHDHVSMMDTDNDWDPPRERIQRQKIREERRRERRLEAKDAAMRKRSNITRDRDRDMSEKVALGMAWDGSARGGEVMYDQWLFNQEKGMNSGFATDDQCNVYDKGLFTAQPTLSTSYRPKKDVDNEMYGGADEQLEKIRKTDRFKPDKGFTGACEKSGRPRDGRLSSKQSAGLARFKTIFPQFAVTKVVIEYEPLSAILSIEDAVKFKSFHPNSHRSLSKGDVDLCFRSNQFHKIIEGEVHMGSRTLVHGAIKHLPFRGFSEAQGMLITESWIIFKELLWKLRKAQKRSEYALRFKAMLFLINQD
ncbi:hypothetical protein L1987_34709 [Smallanthus sonchifolius]|uniref:Uncharacterized protein n=1 Tax=Smallanthus sonchifolius TaxID=185202 RepID=A0ACB9HVT8_9ASTR|nr:hypothetical protein L1987_34709 [Smallanthus sonchifolius]